MATFDLTKKDKPMVYDEKVGDFVPAFSGTDELGDYKAPITKGQTEQINKFFGQHSSGAQREKMGKPRYDLMPARIVNDYYAAIADFGAKKYAPRNWEKGLPQSQIADSLQRHLWAYMEGEDLDQESNLPHAGHILWNAVALLYGYHHKKEDDRIPLVF